ncbi:MAG: aldo/keto reductase [Saprospiraceae bacterium]
MEKRICQNTGLELSVLGLGCWSFGGGGSDYWGQRDQKDVEDIVRTALDLGINYFDTAEIYNDGRSEISLGQAIKGIPRAEIIIGSKVSPANCQPATLVEHCEASLRRLQTDYLDLYMIHWPVHSKAIKSFTQDEDKINHPPPIKDVYETLLKLRQAGKIRHIGISNFAVSKLKELPERSEIAINQLAYNLISRAIEIEVLPYCAQYGIGVMGYMGLMQGILADKWPTFDDIPPLRRRTRHFDSRKIQASRTGEYGFETETAQALADIKNIAQEIGCSMADLSLKWIQANPFVTCNLVGASSTKQIKANAKALEQKLSPAIVEQLNRATQALKEGLGNHIDLFEGAANDRTI